MTIKIGSRIKELRREQNVTQDGLAEAIGVTPQAISRWESETGYPDIEFLPAIADFFAVSIDELIGYRMSEREAELSRIKEEMKRLSEVGTIDERINFSRNALIRFPGDREIKNQLAVSLYFRYQEQKDESSLEEAKTLSNSVLENCTDLYLRSSAINTLIGIFKETGEPEEALKLTEMLVPMKFCREFALSGGVGDGKTEWYIQDEIDKLTDCLGTAIENLALNDDLPNDESTWNKKIEMLEISNKLYRLIYGDDLMFYHVRLAMNYWLISTYTAGLGQVDDTLDALGKMCEHTVSYDRSYEEDHGRSYTSIFTDKLVYPEPSEDFHELTEHNQSYYQLDRLKNKRYDFIRNNDRFTSVMKKLEENAR